MKKIRPFLFVCMFVLLSLSLTACAGRKNGNMNGTEQNSATSSAASESGNGTTLAAPSKTARSTAR